MKKSKYKDAGLAIRRVIIYIILIILSVFSLFSFYMLIINSTRPHSQIQQGFSILPGKWFINNIKNVLKDENIHLVKGIINSLIVGAGSALLATYFSALTAFGIHAYEFRLKKAAFAFILAVMMVPNQVSAAGFVKLVYAMGLRDKLIPLILPSIAAPIVFYFMIAYMKSNLNVSMVEAARIDGSGEFSTFNRIVIPIMKPAMAVQMIFTFVNSWNNYFIPALLLSSNNKKTIPVLIAQLRSADYQKFDMGKVYGMILLAILPVIIIYLCLSRMIIGGVAVGSVKE